MPQRPWSRDALTLDHFFESNARSPTTEGALYVGGSGLMLIETIQARQNRENTLDLIVLIVLVVIAMEKAPGWMRRELIGCVQGD